MGHITSGKVHKRAKINICVQTAVSPDSFTCGEVLNNAGRGRVEDDVGTVIQVMQVIATVKASVAKHVVESQLLHSHTRGKGPQGKYEQRNKPTVGTATHSTGATHSSASWGYRAALPLAPQDAGGKPHTQNYEFSK